MHILESTQAVKVKGNNFLKEFPSFIFTAARTNCQTGSRPKREREKARKNEAKNVKHKSSYGVRVVARDKTKYLKAAENKVADDRCCRRRAYKRRFSSGNFHSADKKFILARVANLGELLPRGFFSRRCKIKKKTIHVRDSN